MPSTAEGRTAVLAIAGSDCGGGAGIAMDLKVLSARHVHGLCAIAAVTAQTNAWVRAIHVVPAAQLAAQLQAAFDAWPVAAIKIGMLGSVANARAVARFLVRQRAVHIVLDPVLAASSGRRLQGADAWRVLRDELLPLATLVTPNLPEARHLLGMDRGDPRRALASLRESGCGAVLLKGGHGTGRRVTDILLDAHGRVEYVHQRLPWGARGTGCALSSAIAAGLARGLDLRAAVADAQTFLQAALANAFACADGTTRILSTTA